MSNTLADYNMWLVLLSYIVSVVGSLTGLVVAQHIRKPDGGLNLGWLAAAAGIIGGCAIWAMHFIGMSAYDPGGLKTYDTIMTIASIIIPIVFVFVGLYVAFAWPGRAGALIGAGIVTGLGVAAMHYTGMAAMRMAAYMSYDAAILGLSIVIAIVAATAALHIMQAFRGAIRYASALVMGIAVCGMHYTGMAAMQIEAANIDINYFDGALTERMTIIWVLSIVVGVCLITTLLAINKAIDGTIDQSLAHH